MKNIDSDALILVNRMLGLAGGGQVVPTLLDDGTLSMTLDVIQASRRARALGVTEGWFVGYLDNVHAGAGVLSAQIFPYAPTTANAVNAYPADVPRGFDVWITSVSCRRVLGTGTLDGAVLEMDPTGRHQGWGIDDGGTAVVADTPLEIARWTALDTATTIPLGIAGDGSANVRTLFRFPRGVALRFMSDVAGASATIRCAVSLALFPEAVGQDVAS